MLGSHLRETERLALYKFFLSSKRDQFISDAKKLIEFSELNREIANGEIHYAIKGDLLTYSARKKGDLVYLENLRTIKLSKITKFRTRKIMKFFAQCEVDVIWNYPIPSRQPEEDGNFSIISLPYFDLRYYSAGRGRIRGFLKKIQANDSEILEQLRAS